MRLSSKIMVVTIFLLLLVSCTKTEKPKEKCFVRLNVNDLTTEEPVSGTYMIISDNRILASGTTIESTEIIEFQRDWFRAENETKLDMKYVSDKMIEFHFWSDEYYHQRTIDFGLNKESCNNDNMIDILVRPIKYADLKITHNGSLEDFYLNISQKGRNMLREINFCVRWSENILRIDNDWTKQPIIPKRLKNKVDACYYTATGLDPNINQILYHFKIKKFRELTKDDYLRIYIIDKDLIQENMFYDYVWEDSNGNDISRADIIYEVKNQ